FQANQVVLRGPIMGSAYLPPKSEKYTARPIWFRGLFPCLLPVLFSCSLGSPTHMWLGDLVNFCCCLAWLCRRDACKIWFTPRLALCGIILMWPFAVAQAQNLAPRAYVIAPIHTNALTLTYS